MLIAEELKYTGTLCVEFFIDRNDNLYVNEIAPRVHNSGHLTIEAYNISQFENHVRAVMNLENSITTLKHDAVMTNILGSDIIDARKSKYLNKQFWLSSSDRLMYEGKAPELADTKAARMPAFFEHSNVNLPQYA